MVVSPYEKRWFGSVQGIEMGLIEFCFWGRSIQWESLFAAVCAGDGDRLFDRPPIHNLFGCDFVVKKHRGRGLRE
jgi:hypothetical protein